MAKEDAVRILVVEDDKDQRDLLREYLEMQPEFEWCGAAKDGYEALDLIEKLTPDVVLMDLFMPRLDGIGVLEELHQRPPVKVPRVIVVSAMGKEKVTKEALELGAEYFFVKPYQLDSLKKRILLATGRNKILTQSELSLEISRTVLAMGAPTNFYGYKYIQEAIEILLTKSGPCPIGKMVYETIANHNGTSVQCVESAVRKTIRHMYVQKTQTFKQVMENSAKPIVKCPSNGAFLTMTAEYIRLKTAVTL